MSRICEVFSWDSGEEDATTSETSRSHKCLVIQVNQPGYDASVITLSSSDGSENVCCLNFAEAYEAIFPVPSSRSDCTPEIISGTEIDLNAAYCTVTEASSTQFATTCYDVNDATLTMEFQC